MTQAAAEAELMHAPVRLAYWRIAAMDTLLDRLEELRLAGERALPEDIRDLVVAYAARHDAELADRVQRIDPDDLNAVHDAVFEAQGRVKVIRVRPGGHNVWPPVEWPLGLGSSSFTRPCASNPASWT